jgi:DNA-binding NarL/FixJ family response regulator
LTAAAATGRIRVLLADDVADLRLVLRISLELDGRFEIAGEAADGIEAIRLAAELLPDAIVLDLAMPGMDGLEAASEILRRSPATKVLVFSAFDSSEMARPALERGAVGYLEKGTDLSEVAERLADACRSNRKRGPRAS